MIMSEKKLVIFFPMENIFQVLDLTYVAVTSLSSFLCICFFVSNHSNEFQRLSKVKANQ